MQRSEEVIEWFLWSIKKLPILTAVRPLSRLVHSVGGKFFLHSALRLFHFHSSAFCVSSKTKISLLFTVRASLLIEQEKKLPLDVRWMIIRKKRWDKGKTGEDMVLWRFILGVKKQARDHNQKNIRIERRTCKNWALISVIVYSRVVLTSESKEQYHEECFRVLPSHLLWTVIYCWHSLDT